MKAEMGEKARRGIKRMFVVPISWMLDLRSKLLSILGEVDLRFLLAGLRSRDASCFM